MTLPRGTDGYGLGPGEGEALWFNGGFGLLKATADQTAGRFAVMELLAPKDFASPLHIHRNEDEFFVVVSGEVRVKHGEDVIEAVAGSLVYGAARRSTRVPCGLGGGSHSPVLRTSWRRRVLPRTVLGFLSHFCRSLEWHGMAAISEAVGKLSSKEQSLVIRAP
jgi:Cupin domain